MGTHISARVAWHNDGWNGRVCEDPAANTFCVGAQSYPGQHIAEKRALDWELECRGRPCKELDRIPPCCYSHNAFGLDSAPAEAAPPVWFNDGTRDRRWVLPPATVCVWPYEVMYGDDVKAGGRFDYDQRLANAREFFDAIERDRSLIFYYANYSNPFSEDEAKRYVLVGLSRVKSVGEEIFYDGCSEAIKERYGGGFVWQRAITSHYPDEGLRLPYHVYRDRPDVLNRIALFPENPRLCKYATRHFADDDALALVEGFLRAVRELQEIGDSTEDWAARTRWIEGLISELWRHRGLLPGVPAVLELLSLEAAIPVFKKRALAGKEVEARDALFAFVEGKTDSVPGLKIEPADAKSVRRQWKLRTREEQRLLRDVVPRFALGAEQIAKVLDEGRAKNGITVDLDTVAENPYVLSEQYQGDDPDDSISWGAIDRGMIPSPELGGEAMAAADDPRRFRALLVEALTREESHVFAPADAVITAVNRRLSVLPEWKRFSFHDRYLAADEEFIAKAVVTRQENRRTYLYLRDAFEDERLLEEKLRFLIGGPDIELRTPVTAGVWNGYLDEPQSVIATKAPEQYRAAIEKQVEACQRVFVRPIGVLAGEAGTGKTTVIRALIKAIKRGHGVGSSVIALAPTGKAADRIREVVEKDEALQGHVEVATIHSFLAKRGWLNPNMTFKRSGGQVEESYATYILDESSMLELGLTATFFRAVRWPTVQRLILVGDPNQLPPIGRGRLFADIIEFVRKQAPESIATLEHNLRQLVGRLTGGATGIIDLAQCYLYERSEGPKNEEITTTAEMMLQRVQVGGDIAPDLRVIYWHGQEELSRVLLERMAADLAEDVRARGDEPEGELKQIWWQAHEKNSKPAYFQVLSPYRGEHFGVEEINRVCQEHIRGARPEGAKALGGVMLFDKVIQVRNRPRSWPIWAWNHTDRCAEAIEILTDNSASCGPTSSTSRNGRRHTSVWRSSVSCSTGGSTARLATAGGWARTAAAGGSRRRASRRTSNWPTPSPSTRRRGASSSECTWWSPRASRRCSRRRCSTPRSPALDGTAPCSSSRTCHRYWACGGSKRPDCAESTRRSLPSGPYQRLFSPSADGTRTDGFTIPSPTRWYGRSPRSLSRTCFTSGTSRSATSSPCMPRMAPSTSPTSPSLGAVQTTSGSTWACSIAMTIGRTGRRRRHGTSVSSRGA